MNLYAPHTREPYSTKTALDPAEGCYFIYEFNKLLCSTFHGVDRLPHVDLTCICSCSRYSSGTFHHCNNFKKYFPRYRSFCSRLCQPSSVMSRLNRG
ncbi:hypothetical protein GOODEAATRI_002312 [Goodea atripinnis]|uniref:Uncharacterized protein n=1 Tax=Goodea atripinnis TaxID=208336 RepID=A0ABV0NR78_9TELE